MFRPKAELMNQPKISIVCPSYNHDKYIINFIESVLVQTEKNFELIIIDDCSQDNNLTEIKKFKDSRIKLIQQKYNSGINACFNKGANLAKGEYISFIASDDLLEPNYFARVLQEFEQNPSINVVYTTLQHIDIDNNLLPTTTPLPIGKSRFEILRELFLNDNILPSPGMVIKRQALLPLLPLPVGLLQYTDLQLHIWLLLNNDCSLIAEPLIKYRVTPSSASRMEGVRVREGLETPTLMDSFLMIKDVELLKKIFPQELAQFPVVNQSSIPYILGRIALQTSNKYKQNWGYKTIMCYLSQDANNLHKLHEWYQFSFKNLIQLTPEYSDDNKIIKEKMKKYKRLSNTLIVLLILSLCFSIFLMCI